MPRLAFNVGRQRGLVRVAQFLPEPTSSPLENRMPRRGDGLPRRGAVHKVLGQYATIPGGTRRSLGALYLFGDKIQSGEHKTQKWHSGRLLSLPLHIDRWDVNPHVSQPHVMPKRNRSGRCNHMSAAFYHISPFTSMLVGRVPKTV